MTMTCSSPADRAMYDRMAELVEPARQSAAIVFADLPRSCELTRRLPTAVYFRLLQQLTETFDELVSRHGGIVGKHAGDGMTAFFLESQLGDTGRATAGALRTAAGLQRAAPAVFDACLGHGSLGDTVTRRFDIGLHWGGNVYIGQLVRGGRLELTAVGDEVNECARVQESASNGSALATKQFIERVDSQCLEEYSIELSKVVYEPIASFPTATSKALRDAGTIAVATLTLVEQ